MPGSMRRFSGTLEHPPPRQNPMDRRHSNASDTSLPDTSHVRQLSQENVEYIPTRLTKVTAPKPAANPLQFIKVGPASLYKSAQEQLKKVEEIKKVTKEVRDEAEDWQSNLDNWKSSRRKRQEHIIERVVEVKKIEMEEYDRNRRRSKTFSEMMEERNSRGRKSSLVPVLYKDEDANDLSDLGITASSGRGFMNDGYDHDNHQNKREKEENENHNYQQGNNGHIDDDGSSATTFSSPEPEEYTYERAIQGYVNYAETRAKSRTPLTKSNKNNSRGDNETEKLSNGHGKGLPPSPPHTPRRQSAAKIEEKLSALEKRRRSSTEINNSVNKDLKMPLAKGEILKRRAMFELANDLSEFASKPMRRLSSDTSSKTKQCNKANSADSKENSRLSSGETSPVKEKLAEKATNGRKGIDTESKQRLSNGDLSSTPSIQERLSNLEKQSLVTEKKEHSENCVTESIKDRLSNLDSSCNKETNRKVTPDRDPSFQVKLANFQNTEEPEKVVNGIDNLSKHTKDPGADSERSSSPEEDVIYETKRQSFHQSLDSLDVEGSSDVGNEAFERVHSLEDLDCCSNARNYPASASSMEMLAFSSQSGDTDREDSGIHTADVSCSVSQADEPVEDGEIVATINSVIPHLETNSSGADVYHLEVEIINQKQAQSPVSVSSSVMNESTEMSTAYLDVKNNTECSVGSSSSSPPMEGELNVNQPSFSKNNVVSPRSLSSLSVVVEENEEFLSVQMQEHAETNTADPENLSLVMAANLDSTQTLNELSIESLELENSHVLDDISTPTNLINPSESSADSDNLSFICYNNTAPNSPIEIPDDNVLELPDETFKMMVDTDNKTNYVQVHNHDPKSHPAENASSTDIICMQHPGSGSAWDEASAADIEVYEKIDECVQSPSHSPLNMLHDTILKEPRKMEQDTLLSASRMGPQESKIYSEKSELPNDSNATIVNSETTIIDETVNSKDCTDNQQLPSTENSVQHFPTEVKPKLNSVSVNQSEDEVFLPISTSKILPLELSSDVEIVAGLAFPLGPPTSTEPPKEKPPPPPTELNDEELPPQKASLKRLDSTKRIKKEMWRKRSDFLGIDGGDDESYLEPELKVAPPPDMTTFLVEERRSEQQLYRQSICSETDSNHGETTESRDSGVELDRAHSDDWNGKLSSTPEILSAQHSRQNSDIYGTASITSEEDEIMKKEREIIEILEKEEQWRYRNNTTVEESDIGEKLAVKLRQLEQEKMRLEWERTEEENKRQMKENARREEELRLQAKEQELRQQESLVASPMTRSSVTGKEERIVSASGEALQAERERLQRENEELRRQKETLQLRESQQLQHSHGQQQHWGSTTMLPHQQWSNEAVLPMTHLSLQDISMAPAGNINSYSPSTAPMVQSPAPLNYRLSLPDLQQEEQNQNQQQPVRPTSLMPTPRVNPNRRPPPPIPPAKPLRVVSQEQRERENSIRNSRMPSADSIPQHVETTHVHHGSVPAHVGSQPISRQTLQALSAVPRSRFIANDMWMQPKKKPENQRSTGRESSYNYQHWLIQEAEHRRITEQQQRTAVSPRKSSPPHPPHTSHQSPWGTSQPQHRQEKPLPDAIIQTLTQRVQNRVGLHDNKSVISTRRRIEESTCRDSQPVTGHVSTSSSTPSNNPALSGAESQEKMLSVSGKKKCSHCGEELGRGAAMIIESLRLFYHIDCFKCCVCHVQLGDGLMGTDVRVRNNKLHCHNCYSSDDGVKFSCV